MKKILTGSVLFLSLILLIVFQWQAGSKMLANIISQKEENLSTGRIDLQNNQLNLQVQIHPDQKSNFESFVKNISEIDTNLLDGQNRLRLGMQIDTESVSKIKNILPVDLTFQFREKSVEFKSNKKTFLTSSLAGHEYQYATNQASVSLLVNGDSNFKLDVKDPSILIIDATTSGKMRLSSSLSSILPIAEKIARIEIRGESGGIEGTIILK